MNRFVCLVVALSFVAAPVRATDLSKIERTIAKEPAYQAKPRYCLLVFGVEAKHRVWLVLDGSHLYVDRNGNGDVTEPGEKFAAEKETGDGLSFKVPEIRAGARAHRNLQVWVGGLDHLATVDKRAKALFERDPKAKAYMLGVDVEMPGRQGSGPDGRVSHRTSPVDARGVLQFAERAQDAPIIHFDGALAVSLFGEQHLKAGRETDVVLGVGTPGVGPGTHTWIDYDGVIPEAAHPTLEIVFPPQRAGASPTRAKFELKERC